MKCLRVTACLAALIFSLSSMAVGAEFAYSGVPGKWKRGAKSAKDKAPEAEAEGKEAPAKEGKETPAKEAPKEKGKKSKTGPAPKTSEKK